jgi:CCR4-NOT transcription complex subunit 4
MWCWHRIRESESGLCPACRTPYGDDPHEFSAVDVEEVLKANKEKEAAAKRERERQRHEQTSGMSSEVEGLAGGRSSGQMDIPKDRTQLANMRVIRRNLVYAVGLPPEIATEEKLKRPEYFGQYGKIAKIVLNRNQITPGTDIRRGSASAYVTFVHKVRSRSAYIFCLPTCLRVECNTDLTYFFITGCSGGHFGLYLGTRWFLHGRKKHQGFLRHVEILLRIY